MLKIFISPARIKPLLEQKIMSLTGRVCDIGEVSWTLVPQLGMTVKNIHLKNPTDVTPGDFVAINHLTISVAIQPLFRKQIVSKGFIVDGLNVNLLRDRNNQVNWQLDLKEDTNDENGTFNFKNLFLGLLTSGLSIKHSSFHFNDAISLLSIRGDDISLYAKQLNFNINTHLQGHGKLRINSTTAEIDVQMDYLLRKNLLLGIQDLTTNALINLGQRKIKLNLVGNGVLDPIKQAIRINKMKGSFGQVDFDSQLGGDQIFSKPHYFGTAKIVTLNLKKILGGNSINSSPVQANIQFDYAKNRLSLDGDLALLTLNVDQLKLTNIRSLINWQDNHLIFKNISGQLYGGNLVGQLKVNMGLDSPRYTLSSQLLNIQLSPLLHDLNFKSQFSIDGLANVATQMATVGITKDRLINEAEGNIKVQVNQGRLIGIDIPFWMATAQSLISRTPNSVINSNQTSFNLLTTTFLLSQGRLTNNDLLITTNALQIQGGGQINLSASSIDYLLKMTAKSEMGVKTGIANLYGLTIPIRIKGALNKPMIGLDTATLLKSVAEQQLKDKIQHFFH